MSVFDDQRIEDAIARWYTGTVINVRHLRPQTFILDDAIPTVLRRAARHPTFVTVNNIDFWNKIEADGAYCVVCLRLPGERNHEVPEILREIVRLEEYRTKRGRMGAVISYRNGYFEDYRS